MPNHKKLLNEQRLLDNIIVNPETACWLWAGAITGAGYGALQANHKYYLAHRASYMVFVGPIPEGKVIDHLCGTPRCVSPHHLQAVSVRTNIVRGGNTNRDKTHCAKGHEFSEENTLFEYDNRGVYVFRKCRVCTYARNLSRYHKQRKEKGLERRKIGPKSKLWRGP